MKKKKKKKHKSQSLGPRAKRMKRSTRLDSAKHWLKEYNGKNLVRGYRNHFGVDLLCAAKELAMLGVKLDPAYVKQLHQTVANKAKHRKNSKTAGQPSTKNENWHSYESSFDAYIDGDYAALYAMECERDGVDRF